MKKYRELVNFYLSITKLTIQMDTQYLKTDPVFADKLTQLLDSQDDTNIRLAYQLMQGGGIPNSLAKRISDHIEGKILCLEYGLTPVLAHLQILQIYDTYLQELPPSIGSLKQLMILELINNQLVDIPPEIQHLTKLTDLQLVANNLTSLPAEMGALQQLEKLNVYGNQLATLPTTLFSLPKLESLNLGANQLQTLSPQMCQMRALRKLDIGTNPLQNIVPTLVQMPWLEMLSLSGLKLSDQEWQQLKAKLPYTQIIR